jgi:hypothetical protein
MGGKGDNDYDKDTKIIKKIAKVVCIEKDWNVYGLLCAFGHF